MSNETGRHGGSRDLRGSFSVPSHATDADTLGLYEFGPFCLDPTERKLTRGNELVSLTPKVFDTLHLLVRNSGHLLEKDELIRKLWPDSFVEEGNLSNNIFVLRKALGEDPQYIETVPKRGYRFVGAVRRLSNVKTLPLPDGQTMRSSYPVQPAPSDAAPRGRSRRMWSTFAAISLAVLALAGIAWRVVAPRFTTANQSKPQIRSLAVLPLTNLSNDPEQEYFSDGLTEALTNDLGKCSGLRVISRTSTMQYKTTKKAVPEIAQDLSVDAVIEGTVLRSGNHVRVTVNLIQAHPEKHLWAETYDTEAGDILNVQAAVALAVARAIDIRLPSERSMLNGRELNPVAQDLYFRGLHALESGGAGASQNAVDYLQGAIKEDPNFADAYGALAMAYATWYPADLGPRVRMPKAREAALKAVALDNSAASGHMALAYIDLNYDWNFAEAEREFKRTLELEPNFGLARDFYARELVILGRTDESIAEVRRALELEPSGQDLAAWIFYLARRYNDALAIAQKLVAMDPNYSWGHWSLAANYEQLGKQKEAAEEYLRFELLSGAPPQRIKRLQEGLARSGVKGFWQASLDDYRKTAKSSYVPPVLVAGVCMRLGDKACALQWLEKGYQDRDDLMNGLNVDPIFDGIRADPRFEDLVRRVGLPDGKPQT